MAGMCFHVKATIGYNSNLDVGLDIVVSRALKYNMQLILVLSSAPADGIPLSEHHFLHRGLTHPFEYVQTVLCSFAVKQNVLIAMSAQPVRIA